MHDDQLGAARGIVNCLIIAGAVAASLIFASYAFAQPGGEPNNTGCQGQGNPNSPCVPTSGNGGGQGGAGGNALSASRATARATARANARANATGGRASARGGQGGNAAATGGAGGNASVTNNVSGGSGATYVEARERQRVPDASAPAIWSNNPCMVGLSGGVAVAGFGMSLGAGIEDRDCTRRANAQHLVAMGEREAAREVLCESAEVRAAFARIGRPCVADQRPMVSTTYREVIGGAPARIRPAYCATLLARGMVTQECE